MTTYYARSTNTASGDGLSWTNAYKTLAEITALDALGDVIYVSQAHAENTTGANVTLDLAGTPSNLTRIICASDASLPPTAVASTGTVTASSASTGTITVNGSGYIEGLTFTSGINGGVISLAFTLAVQEVQYYKNCKFRMGATNSNARLSVGRTDTSTADKVTWENCTVRFSHATSAMQVIADFHWKGGGVESGGTAISALLYVGTGRQVNILIEGCDFSTMSSTAAMVGASGTSGRITFRYCKLPANWTGDLCVTPPPGLRVMMHNCDNGDTNYKLYEKEDTGTVRDETVIVATGGASNGTTSMAWKMESTSLAAYPARAFASPEMVRWNDTTGSAITVSVEVLHDSLTALNNEEAWLEVQYMGTSGVPLGSFVHNAKANILATAAAQPSSSAAWTTTGLTNPNKQFLSVTFTPQEKGYLHAKVLLAKPDKVLYINPKMTVA